MELVLTILMFNFPFALIGALVGSRKGETGTGFIVGGLFGIFGLLFVIFSRGNRKTCPHCRSYVHREATACHKCGRDFYARVAREKMRHEQ